MEKLIEILELEQKNTEKRKQLSLSNSETLSFFFLPWSFFNLDKTKSIDFNESQLKRYKEYGFELKLKQAKQLIRYGRLFYISLVIIVTYYILF